MNRRTPAGPDPESGAFDLARQPPPVEVYHILLHNFFSSSAYSSCNKIQCFTGSQEIWKLLIYLNHDYDNRVSTTTRDYAFDHHMFISILFHSRGVFRSQSISLMYSSLISFNPRVIMASLSNPRPQASTGYFNPRGSVTSGLNIPAPPSSSHSPL